MRRLHRPDRRPARSARASPASATAAGKPSQHHRGARRPATSCTRFSRRSSTVGAMQCGYCTPGMIMSAVGAADAKPDADPRRDRPGHERQHLPLRHLPADRRRRRAGRQGDEGGWQMNPTSSTTSTSSPNATSCSTIASNCRDRPAATSSASPAAGLIVALLLGRRGATPSGQAAAAAAARARSAPGSTSARTAPSPSTPARWRSARTSAPRSPRPSPRNCTRRSRRSGLVMADTAAGAVRRRAPSAAGRRRDGRQLRRAAAAAREVLLDLAAEQGKVERGTLAVADGKVVGPDGKPTFAFGELTKGKKLMKVIGAAPTTAAAKKWTVAGTSVPKVGRPRLRHRHAPVRVRHRAGRGCCSARSCGRRRSRPSSTSVDTKAAEAMPGVKVVRDGDFVGVVGADRAGRRAEALARDQGRVEDDRRRSSRQGPVRAPQGEPRRRRQAAASAAGAAGAGLDRRRPQGRRQDGQGDLHGRLHRPRPAGAAGRGRRVGRRQADRLDRHAAAVRRARRAGAARSASRRTRSA